jgi:hypothetical protein
MTPFWPHYWQNQIRTIRLWTGCMDCRASFWTRFIFITQKCGVLKRFSAHSQLLMSWNCHYIVFNVAKKIPGQVGFVFGGSWAQILGYLTAVAAHCCPPPAFQTITLGRASLGSILKSSKPSLVARHTSRVSRHVPFLPNKLAHALSPLGQIFTIPLLLLQWVWFDPKITRKQENCEIWTKSCTHMPTPPIWQGNGTYPAHDSHLELNSLISMKCYLYFCTNKPGSFVAVFWRYAFAVPSDLSEEV